MSEAVVISKVTIDIDKLERANLKTVDPELQMQFNYEMNEAGKNTGLGSAVLNNLVSFRTNLMNKAQKIKEDASKIGMDPAHAIEVQFNLATSIALLDIFAKVGGKVAQSVESLGKAQ